MNVILGIVGILFMLLILYVLLQIYSHMQNKKRIEIYADCLIHFCLKKGQEDFNYKERISWLKDEIDAYHIPSIKVLDKAIERTKITNKIDLEKQRDEVLKELFSLERSGFSSSPTYYDYIKREVKGGLIVIAVILVVILLQLLFERNKP